MDSTFVKSYISFVGMLISAKPEYLNLVLDKVSYGLTYRTFCCVSSWTLHLCDLGQNRVFKP